MSIKLIAVDIDGTLVNSQKEITSEVFSAIQDAKEAGVKVVIATGRPIAGVAKLLDDLQLRDEGDYVVTFNGALVQETATGHEIISESLTYEDYLDMEFLSRKLGVHMHAITKDGIYTANRNIGKYTVHESTLVSMPIFYRTPEEMADKEGSDITHLAEKLGLSKDETMAIGDEENDRAMLEVVGNPVVMENGNPEIKKIAKYITKTNDESGVAHAIRTWVL